MNSTKSSTTVQEFIKHLQAGGSFFYVQIQHYTIPSECKFISTQSGVVFNYLIKSDSEVIVKRFSFGQMKTINFKLEFVTLIPISK